MITSFKLITLNINSENGDFEFERLITEQRNFATTNIDRMNTIEGLRLINKEDKKVAKAVEAEIPKISRTVDYVIKAFVKGGRLIYVGAGTSGRLGIMDAAECPPTFSTNSKMVQALIAGGMKAMFKAVEGAEDDIHKGAEDVRKLKVSNNDVVIGLSSSGRTPYVIGALKEAHRKGAKTVAIATVNEPKIGYFADVVIAPIVGPEVLTGSTRMKAGTAEKMILNMISTMSMIKIGKAYTNLMIDLKPMSAKLRSRARRILNLLTDLSSSQAKIIFECSGRNLKVALVMALANRNKKEAEKALKINKGLIWKATESLKPTCLVKRRK